MNKKLLKHNLIEFITLNKFTNKQLINILNYCSNIGLEDKFNDFLSKIINENNIPFEQILKFNSLIEKYNIKNIIVNKLLKDRPAFNLEKEFNITSYYSEIDNSIILGLYRDMGSSIHNNVSIGPGEILLSILFNNIKKQEFKGDLLIDNKNIELKASTNGSGAVIAYGYNRGEWSTTRKKGDFDTFINQLGLNSDDLIKAKNILESRVKWPTKLSRIYCLESIDEQLFYLGFREILNKLYNKSIWTNGGKYINFEKYFIDNTFHEDVFIVDLTKELVNEYILHENFDGLLFIDKNGNTRYFEGKDSILNAIGIDIKILGPSDDVPRLKI
jgi:hypothetical protein